MLSLLLLCSLFILLFSFSPLILLPPFISLTTLLSNQDFQSLCVWRKVVFRERKTKTMKIVIWV